MRVNIGGRSDSAVTKPRLNFLHGDTLGKQKRCTAMPKSWNSILNSYYSFSSIDEIKLLNSAF